MPQLITLYSIILAVAGQVQENPPACDPQANEEIWGDTTETGEVDEDIIIDEEIDPNENEGMSN